jgi:tRNA dimethylallyltransferase
MVENGLFQEVEALKEYRHLNALNTVGYSEIFEYFDENLSEEEAIEKIKQNTRRFAKRQLTWFKKSGDMHWFDPLESGVILDFLDDAIVFSPERGPKKLKNRNKKAIVLNIWTITRIFPCSLTG